MLGKNNDSNEKAEAPEYVEAAQVQPGREPSVVLDAKAEKRMYRKMDLRLLPILALLYLVAFLDRGVSFYRPAERYPRRLTTDFLRMPALLAIEVSNSTAV